RGELAGDTRLRGGELDGRLDRLDFAGGRLRVRGLGNCHREATLQERWAELSALLRVGDRARPRRAFRSSDETQWSAPRMRRKGTGPRQAAQCSVPSWASPRGATPSRAQASRYSRTTSVRIWARSVSGWDQGMRTATSRPSTVAECSPAVPSRPAIRAAVASGEPPNARTVSRVPPGWSSCTGG